MICNSLIKKCLPSITETVFPTKILCYRFNKKGDMIIYSKEDSSIIVSHIAKVKNDDLADTEKETVIKTSLLYNPVMPAIHIFILDDLKFVTISLTTITLWLSIVNPLQPTESVWKSVQIIHATPKDFFISAHFINNSENNITQTIHKQCLFIGTLNKRLLMYAINIEDKKIEKFYDCDMSKLFIMAIKDYTKYYEESMSALYNNNNDNINNGQQIITEPQTVLDNNDNKEKAKEIKKAVEKLHLRLKTCYPFDRELLAITDKKKSKKILDINCIPTHITSYCINPNILDIYSEYAVLVATRESYIFVFTLLMPINNYMSKFALVLTGMPILNMRSEYQGNMFEPKENIDISKLISNKIPLSNEEIKSQTTQIQNSELYQKNLQTMPLTTSFSVISAKTKKLLSSLQSNKNQCNKEKSANKNKIVFNISNNEKVTNVKMERNFSLDDNENIYRDTVNESESRENYINNNNCNSKENDQKNKNIFGKDKEYLICILGTMEKKINFILIPYGKINGKVAETPEKVYSSVQDRSFEIENQAKILLSINILDVPTNLEICQCETQMAVVMGRKSIILMVDLIHVRKTLLLDCYPKISTMAQLVEMLNTYYEDQSEDTVIEKHNKIAILLNKMYNKANTLYTSKNVKSLLGGKISAVPDSLDPLNNGCTEEQLKMYRDAVIRIFEYPPNTKIYDMKSNLTKSLKKYYNNVEYENFIVNIYTINNIVKGAYFYSTLSDPTLSARTLSLDGLQPSTCVLNVISEKKN